MARIWVTNMSTHPESVGNPLVAACEEGFVPGRVHLLSNPNVERYVERMEETLSMVTTAYGRTELDVDVTRLESETDFGGIVSHFRDPIDARGPNDDVAVDLTPGRKFMSAVAFQVGMSEEADHVFYNHVDSVDYFGRVHSTVPDAASELIDFRGLLG